MATRAIPALAGGFVLWDIGCAAGVGLPLCHHEHVRLTHEQIATIRFRFSGSGVGSDALCLPSAASNVLTQPPSSGVCPDQKLYRAPLSGTVVAQQPKMAPNVLDVEWASTNASGWKGVSGCWPGPDTGPAADYTYTYFSPSSVSGAPFAQCNPVVEPSGESFQHLEGLNYGGQAYAETQCGQNAQGTPCWRTSYHTMVRGWYLDPGTTRTLEAPTTGTDPTWPGDGTATPTRLASDMPTRPERGGVTADKVGQALHDHPALRKEIVYVLNRQQPEDEATWGVTEVDDGPAVGRATVPDCTGIAYDTCVSTLHAAGFADIEHVILDDWATRDDLGPGEVVSVQDQGLSRDLDTAVGVATNPSPKPVPIPAPPIYNEDEDNSCDVTPGGAGPQPTATAFGPADPWDVLQSPLPIAEPRFDAGESTMLRWGVLNAAGDAFGPGGWGYRHIQAKHGYGAQDALETAVTLADPTHVPVPTANTDRVGYRGLDPRSYHFAANPTTLFFCSRVVIVQKTAADEAPIGVTDQAGVWTSYSQDVGSLSPTG